MDLAAPSGPGQPGILRQGPGGPQEDGPLAVRDRWVGQSPTRILNTVSVAVLDLLLGGARGRSPSAIADVQEASSAPGIRE